MTIETVTETVSIRELVRFAPAAARPLINSYELDWGVLERWLDVIEHVSDTKEIPDERVVANFDTGLFLNNTHDDDWWWGWFNERLTCHPPTPAYLSPGELLDAMPGAVRGLPVKTALASETMTVPGLSDTHPMAHFFFWLHSPIAVVDYSGIYDKYLESLASKRRRRERIDMAEAENSGLTFSIEAAPMREGDMGWAIDQSRARWEDIAGHNISLFAYYHAVGLVRPERCVTMHVKLANGDLQAIICFIEREPGELVFQSIAQNPNVPCKNLGSMMMFKLLRWMHLYNLWKPGRWRSFDPTCRTDLVESSIDVYKRYCVNQDRKLPMLLAGIDHTAIPWEPTAPYWFGSLGGWRTGDASAGDPL